MSADLLARFAAAVRRDPDRIAVRDTAGALTFADLDRRTAALAGALAERGVGRGDRIGVSLPRGADLLVALLAVWRAGAAYVPLDPSYPDDRLAYLAADAGSRAVITATDPLWLPSDVDIIDPAATGDPVTATGCDTDPAYVIYTSGSTGRPKGVLVARGAVAALVEALEQAGMYRAGPSVVAWNASVSFDASVKQWARVCRGDTIVVLDEDHRTDPAALVAWLTECGVTDLDLTPSHWAALRDHLLAAPWVPRLFLGGEPIPAPLWRELAEASARGRLDAVNLYGPTECTVDATGAWITGPHGPHIGTALPGLRAHVLDPALRPARAGEPGELYLSGERLAVGYLNRPALTAERFVASPYGSPGARMYRTGDEVRWTARGALEFLGRLDRQVKLRGYRVELGEIEAALLACPGVSAAAVVVREDAELGQRLIAYHVSTTDPELLRAGLAAALPDYLVPAEFVRLDELPRTPNGKLDTAALPAPDAAAAPGADPAGEVEEFIADVWSEVLGRDRISADDNFFALGGHSLIVLRLVVRLKKHFGLAMSAKDVYRHPKLSDLARHVESLATR